MYQMAMDERAAAAITKTTVHKGDEETVAATTDSSKLKFSLLIGRSLT
jgi:hypothetical protein